MTHNIAKKQRCIVMRNNIEIWIDEERIPNLIKLVGTMLNTGNRGLVELDSGDIINPAEIVGILTPDAVDTKHRLARGQWKCKYNSWHNRNEQCSCHESILPQWKPPVD